MDLRRSFQPAYPWVYSHRQIESKRPNSPCPWRGKAMAGVITPVLRSLTFTAWHGLMPSPISLADSREGQQLFVVLHGREKHLSWLYRTLHSLPHIRILFCLPIFSLLPNSCPSAVCSNCCPLPLLPSLYPVFATGYKFFIAGQDINSQWP